MDSKLTDKKRRAIISAAIREFNDLGYAAATMDEIAARAEVSKRTVYKHFASKEALFLQITERVCEVVAEATDLAYDPEKSVEEQLTTLAMRQLALLTSDEFLTMARVTLPERVRNPTLSTESFDAMRRGETGLSRWLEQAMRAGALNLPDSKDAGRRFGAMLLEFSFWPVLFTFTQAPNVEACQKIATETVALFLNGCRTDLTKNRAQA